MEAPQLNKWKVSYILSSINTFHKHTLEALRSSIVFSILKTLDKYFNPLREIFISFSMRSSSTKYIVQINMSLVLYFFGFACKNFIWGTSKRFQAQKV